MTDIREDLGLRKIINAAGPVSVFGGGAPSATATAAAMSILPYPVEMASLQSVASGHISSAFGCEAGCVTAGSAAGIVISVAAAMTGSNRSFAEQLPDVAGMRSRVIIQRGHDCSFGARVSQMIRVTGAAADLIGTEHRCAVEDLRNALKEDVCAAIFVVSHHTAQAGMIELPNFCAICHEAGVPVIVDAAGEHDLRDYFSAEADVAIASAHKNFGALTAGIIAGRASFIESCLLQDAGVGRPMKVGKEGVAGVIAALAEWRRLDRTALHADWTRRAGIAIEVLRGIPSVRAELARDIDGSPLFRARIHVKGEVTAEQIANRLVEGEPSIRVWRLGIPRGYFELDPRTVTDDEMLIACRAVGAMACQLGIDLRVPPLGTN